MANIKDKLNNIQNALFGHEVRGSIHDGIEAINNEVEDTTSRQHVLENTFEELTINAGNSNAEIVAARVEADGTTHKKLGDRLNKVDSQIKEKADKDSLYINVIDFGAISTNTNEENKIAVQNAISYADSIGCGVVFIPVDISYGYNRNDVSTHPNFDGINTRIMVVDYSQGDTYNDEVSRDGAQTRFFFNTEGDETDAQHDGNGMFVRGKWHPYIMISNDGEDTNNRRATYFIANRGKATWGIGQGVNTIEGGTDDELSHFKIMGNEVKGSEGFTTCYCIDKVSGKMAWNTNAPGKDFDFIFKNDNTVRFKRNTDGNITLQFETNDGKFRKIIYRDDNDSINFTDKTGKTNVFVLSDLGEGKFSNGITGGAFSTSDRPTGCSQGTMIFDSTLMKPIWYLSGKWYDANGTEV